MGSAGGGSNSGSTDYPTYMKSFHGMILDKNGADLSMLPQSALKSYVNATTGFSPFYMMGVNDEPISDGFIGGTKTLNSYSKVFELLATWQGISFSDTYGIFSETEAAIATVADLATVTGITDLVAKTAIPTIDGDDYLTSLSVSLEDDIVTNILPRFKASMRSMGAVNSSAFAVGEALIWGNKLVALAKERVNVEQVVNQVHSLNNQIQQNNNQVGEINLKNRIEPAQINSQNKLEVLKINAANKLAILQANQNNKDLALRLTLSYIDQKKNIALVTADTMKVYYSLKTDLDVHYTTMASSDVKWDLEMLQYVNNTLSSISGSALSNGQAFNGGGVGSAIGGMLSGAATGAMIPGMGPAGAAAGAAIGLAGSLFR